MNPLIRLAIRTGLGIGMCCVGITVCFLSVFGLVWSLLYHDDISRLLFDGRGIVAALVVLGVITWMHAVAYAVGVLSLDVQRMCTRWVMAKERAAARRRLELLRSCHRLCDYTMLSEANTQQMSQIRRVK